MSDPFTNLLALRDGKQRARGLLSRRFAEALIDTDELDRRLEIVERADQLATIEQVVADLTDPSTVAGPAVLLPAQVPKRRDRELTAVLVKRVRDGYWTPAPRVELRAAIGDVTLDFTGAELRPGVTLVHVDVGLSVARVVVPTGVAVVVDVQVILGSVRRDPGIPETPALPDDPSLVLDGYVVLARLEVMRGSGLS